MSELVSRRELARRLDVTPQAIKKAIDNGRISGSAIVGSQLDAAIATKQFKKNKDISKVRRSKTKVKNNKPKEELVKVTPPDVGIIPSSDIPGFEEDDNSSFRPEKLKVNVHSSEEKLEAEFMFHKTRKEKEAADKLAIDNELKRGKLVEVEKVSNAFFESVRGARNHWLDFSSKYAADLSSELGVDKLDVQNALDKYISKHCEEMGDMRIEV